MPVASTRPRGGRYLKTHIVQHGTSWKYRRTIPLDMREAFGGRTAWVKSLGKDHTQAVNTAHVEDAKNGALIQRWRALKDDERALIIAHGGIDAFHKNGIPDDSGLPFVRAVANLELPTSDDIVPEDGMSEDELAHAVLAIVQARQHVARATEKKARGRKIAAKLADDSTEGGGLMGLVELWVAVRRPRSPKSVRKVRLHMRRFVEVVGDMEPRQLSRSHVIKFRDTLQEQKRSASSIRAHLKALHVIFNTAMSEGVVDVNVAHQVRARKDDRKLSDGRQGFTADHVRTILSKVNDEREDYAWIIRLLIYTGARSGEICQLRCDDVTTISDLPCIRIHDRHGRVKNKASIREIPLPAACHGLGEYAQRIAAKHGADAWLFPRLTNSNKQGRAHGFQNYVTRVFLRKRCGIVGAEYTMHSARHSWRTMAREANCPEPVSRALMGHSQGSGDHASYGTVPSLQQRAEWIAKIDPLKG